MANQRRKIILKNKGKAKYKIHVYKYEVKRATKLIKRELWDAKTQLLLYSSRFSRKDFTLHQLYAILSLKEYLNVDYRTLVEILKIYPELKRALGIKKIPHYSTLAHAHKRIPGEREKFKLIFKSL
jgi:hypothetical protein